MTRIFITALAATLFVSPCGGAFAANPPASPAPAASVQLTKKIKAPTPDDVVCKTVPEPGSRISSERMCMTRGEWDQQAATARNALMGSHPGVDMPK